MPSGADSDNTETQSLDTVESGISGDTTPTRVTSAPRDSSSMDAKKDVKKDKKAGIIQEENILHGGLNASVFLEYLRAM
jgi:hypothetical protein